VASWGGWWKKYPREVLVTQGAFTGRGSLLLDAPDAWLLVAPCFHRRKLELKPYGTMDSGKRKGGQPECVANLRTALFDPGRSWAPGRMGPYGR
jgi:hypothetical protein